MSKKSKHKRLQGKATVEDHPYQKEEQETGQKDALENMSISRGGIEVNDDVEEEEEEEIPLIKRPCQIVPRTSPAPSTPQSSMPLAPERPLKKPNTFIQT